MILAQRQNVILVSRTVGCHRNKKNRLRERFEQWWCRRPSQIRQTTCLKRKKRNVRLSLCTCDSSFYVRLFTVYYRKINNNTIFNKFTREQLHVKICLCGRYMNFESNCNFAKPVTRFCGPKKS